MDGDHALNSGDVGVGVTLAQQGIVHLLRGGVLPVAVAGAPGNGAWISFSGQGVGLVGGFLVGEFAEHVVEGVDLGQKALLGVVGMSLSVRNGT